MADETKPVETKPVLLEKYPRVKKLLELAVTFALAYIGARYGIQIPVADVVAAPAVAPAAQVEHVEAREFACDHPIGKAAEDTTPAIAGKTEYPAHALVKLKAENVKAGAAVLWRVSPRAGVDRATTAGDRFEFAAVPGVYDVELLVITKAGDGFATEEVFTKVTVGAAPKVDPKPDPEKKSGKLDPPAALARIQFGNSGCTATVIGPRRADGRWDILTASHCMPGVGSKGSMKLKDGRSFNVRVVVHEKRPDLAWMITEDATVEDMPFANLSATNPAAGVKVWHAGYGVDVPGNREDGEVRTSENSDGQTQFFLSVSPGDSGGGVLRSDTNEVVSTVCCTAALARKADMFGASIASIRKARPGVVRLDELVEPATGDEHPGCGR